MVQLLLRDVDFDLVRLLRKRAVKNGRSQDEEHRAILEQALRERSMMSGSKLDQIIARLQAGGPTQLQDKPAQDKPGDTG